MADLEGSSSNAFFEALEEWNAVLLAERYLVEQALAADDPAPEDHLPPSCENCDLTSVASVTEPPADPPSAPKGSTPTRGMSQ